MAVGLFLRPGPGEVPAFRVQARGCLHKGIPRHGVEIAPHWSIVLCQSKLWLDPESLEPWALDHSKGSKGLFLAIRKPFRSRHPSAFQRQLMEAPSFGALGRI